MPSGCSRRVRRPALPLKVAKLRLTVRPSNRLSNCAEATLLRFGNPVGKEALTLPAYSINAWVIQLRLSNTLITPPNQSRAISWRYQNASEGRAARPRNSVENWISYAATPTPRTSRNLTANVRGIQNNVL